jgi:hypothetical protein
MDTVQPQPLTSPSFEGAKAPESGGLGILLTTAIFIGILVGLSKMADIQTIKNNWPDYRCRPDVMLFAGLYGHDAAENLQFCLKNGFDERAKAAMGPMFTFLKKFVDILLVLLNSINSIRMIFATIIGSVTRIFTEFSTRIQAFFNQVQSSVIRIKFLMGRIFAVVYSILFMAMSGIKATSNFGNTFLFKFLDTFCFDPDTLVEIESPMVAGDFQSTSSKRSIPIRDVRIGDVFSKSGDRVTATFQFMADGQPMVRLPGDIIVSTNHYLLHNRTWIQAKDHPDALPIQPWEGGVSRPLICLNTESHSFPIGKYTFRDYDETSEADDATMRSVLQSLNGEMITRTELYTNYDTCCGGATKIKLASGVSIPASSITLGTPLTQGTVYGVVVKECKEICIVQGHCVTPGTAIWNEHEKKWMRACDMADTQLLPIPGKCYSFIVSPSACIETESGLMMRDYVEVHSPDTEAAYTKAFAAMSASADRSASADTSALQAEELPALR